MILSNKQHILSLDMACGEIAVCVVRGDESFFSSIPASASLGRMRSTVIVPLMQDVLSQAGLVWSDLQLLALGAGPGSFTGLRIAAATLAGINSGLKLPVLHLSSLAITVRQTGSMEPVWVLEDARAGEVFAACYQAGQLIQADACLSWQDMAGMRAASYCCHSDPAMDLAGWQRMPLLIARSAALAAETAAACASSSMALSEYPVPRYLQLSQAERQAHG